MTVIWQLGAVLTVLPQFKFNKVAHLPMTEDKRCGREIYNSNFGD